MADDEGYASTLSLDHVHAAADALREIATLASCPDESGQRKLRRLRVGHIDHGAFLTLSLHSFALPEVDDQSHLIEAGETGEVTLAVVVNQSVPTQIRTLLVFLASFIARQDLASSIQSGSGNVSVIDSLATASDEIASQTVEDDLRIGDWRRAAVRLSERARNDGYALVIRFSEPLLSLHEINVRTPVLRHVYNTQTQVRNAIDRVTGSMSSALQLSGNGATPEVLRDVQRMVDMGSLKRFLAHLLRDTFVCGNGYLYLGDGVPSDIRLLRPELSRLANGDRYEEYDTSTAKWVPIEGKVLHFTGAKQVNSDYGISVIEPFIQIATQEEIMERAVSEGALLKPPPGRIKEASTWLRDTTALRDRSAEANARRTAELLGTATQKFVGMPSEEIYFPDQQVMGPSVETFVDRSGSSTPSGSQ